MKNMTLILKMDKGLANGFSIKLSEFVKFLKQAVLLALTVISSARLIKSCIRKVVCAT